MAPITREFSYSVQPEQNASAAPSAKNAPAMIPTKNFFMLFLEVRLVIPFSAPVNRNLPLRCIWNVPLVVHSPFSKTYF
ncbi:MAG: hypothetical protein IJR40_10480, partial [Treponema sp.]|nr:hypothetical protein [Treponema sp.]